MNETLNTSVRARPEDLVPRTMIRAVFALIVVCLVMVTWARVSDRPVATTLPSGPVVAERLMIIESDAQGAVRISEPDGALIAEMSQREAGFISGLTRVINRERMLHGVAPLAPIALRRTEGGRLSLFDPSTGWSADMMGFGEDNVAALAMLLDRP